MTAIAKDRIPAHPRLIFMGTPEFAIPTLKALIDQGHDIQAVITQPDRPKGRGKKITSTPVKQLAIKHRIEVLQPERASDDHFCDIVKGKAPDLIIVIAFGQILRKNFLSLPKWGAINIHASLLPEYRGAAPLQWAILNNEPKTGLTIMCMDEGLDTGPILFQEETPILKDETAGQLHDRLALKAGDLIIKSLNHMAENPIKERPQEHSRATYAKKIDRSISRIDWKQPGNNVSALIRALDPWPGAYTTFQGKNIKLFASSVVDEACPDAVPGRVLRVEEGLHVETGKGVIKIGEIQYPGKKRLSASDFLKGFPLPEGTILGS